MQQGRYAAKLVRARLEGRSIGPFRYRDKGNLATIGRAAAVADIKGLKLSGLPAWLTWLGVHLCVPGRLREPADRVHPLGRRRSSPTAAARA